jgi:hypothetical protein
LTYKAISSALAIDTTSNGFPIALPEGERSSVLMEIL